MDKKTQNNPKLDTLAKILPRFLPPLGWMVWHLGRSDKNSSARTSTLHGTLWQGWWLGRGMPACNHHHRLVMSKHPWKCCVLKFWKPQLGFECW